MTVVVFARQELQCLQELARTETVESCAVGFVAPAGVDRFVVRGLFPVEASSYFQRAGARATLRPEACLAAANEARRLGLGVLLAHTHVGGMPAQFSRIDDEGEKLLLEYFGARVPERRHFATVVSTDGVTTRALGGA